MLKTIPALALTAIFLSGCGEIAQNPQENLHEAIETVPVSITDYEDGFKIFTERELVRGLYEPDSGCYIGAYILSDKTTGGEITAFERITGIEHGLYTYIYKIGQPFPTEWVLGCISKMKTPNIIFVPENADEPYNTKLLEEAAKKCGELSVPIFVHFYPVERSKGYEADGYKSFFQIARAYFSQYAPKAAFVWDIHMNDLDMAENFYPGDSFADWVGINISMDIEAESGELSENILPKLDYFYYTFQERKPLFISQLAISHFSSTNHAYYLNEADEALSQIYSRAMNLPRIKAVNYMSYNSIEPLNMAQGNDNYSVASDSRIAAIYKNHLSDDYFLSDLNISSYGEIFTQKYALPYEAIYHGGAFYGDKYFMNAEANNSPEDIIIANGKEYYPLAGLAANGDFSRRTVEVRLNGR